MQARRPPAGCASTPQRGSRAALHCDHLIYFVKEASRLAFWNVSVETGLLAATLICPDQAMALCSTRLCAVCVSHIVVGSAVVHSARPPAPLLLGAESHFFFKSPLPTLAAMILCERKYDFRCKPVARQPDVLARPSEEAGPHCIANI